jgi:hypothetical protein
VNDKYGGEYETEIETADEFGMESQFERCDGGTNFDQDEPESLERGFASNLFGNSVEEAEFAF